MGLTAKSIGCKIDIGGSRRVLFSNLDFNLNESEIMVIVGPSGCGKSSLLRLLAGFNQFQGSKRRWFDDSSHSITFEGESIKINGLEVSLLDPGERGVGYLMQRTKIYPHVSSIEELMLFPYVVDKRLREKFTTEEYETRILEIFESLDLNLSFSGKLKNPSGGEEQRLLLGKMLAKNPEVALMDEPFSGLDVVTRVSLRGLIKKIVKSGLGGKKIGSIVLVSHDLEDCSIADKILVFDRVENSGFVSNTFVIEATEYESAQDIFKRISHSLTSWKEVYGTSRVILNALNGPFGKAILSSILGLSVGKMINELFEGEEYYSIVSCCESDIQLENLFKNKLKQKFNFSDISEKVENRSSIVFSQIKRHVIGNSILDIGCGDGRVSLHLKEENSKREVVLCDVKDYRLKECNDLDFKVLVQGEDLPFDDSIFDTVLLLTVLHHSIFPFDVLREAARITKGKLIVIESILGLGDGRSGNFDLFPNCRKEYAQVADWFYNRVIHDDVLVPYNFDTVLGWRGKFAKAGLNVVAEFDLGLDVSLVPEHHYMFILEPCDV